MSLQKGTFHTLRIQNSQKVAHLKGLKVFGVRLAKFLPDGWEHNDFTSPSKTLLFGAKNLEKNNEWNEESFRTFYRPQFLHEMKNQPQSLKEFRRLLDLLENGEDVFYACYCEKHELCHRSLVADVLEKKGALVERN